MAPTVARAIFFLFEAMMASHIKPWDYVPWGGGWVGYESSKPAQDVTRSSGLVKANLRNSKPYYA